jgi:hypothetical protein
VAYHFAGILSAVTSPPPTPWLADQYWKRVARTYLQFAYFNNAYQFYSPDPGPACEIWVCFEYEPDPGTPDLPDGSPPPKECSWVYFPKREHHYSDPLGLSYYRRLALTENLAQYQPPGYVALAAETDAAIRRRETENHEDRIARYGWPLDQERRIPNEIVTRQILPAYVRYMAKNWADPNRKVKSVWVYRTLHMITTLYQFHLHNPGTHEARRGMSPYDPQLYFPYFQGEFTPDGELKDSTAPLLYWLVPIQQRRDRPLPASEEEYRKFGFDHYYIDGVSRHVGCQRPKE